MKKAFYCLVIALFCSTFIYAQTTPSGNGKSRQHLPLKPYIQLNLGADFFGNLHTHLSLDEYGGDEEDEGDEDNSEAVDLNSAVNTGITPSFEALWPANPNLYLGIGAEYQLQRAIDESYAGNSAFHFIPIYGVAKYQLHPFSNVQPEAIAHLGYGIFKANADLQADSDLSNGVCWGLGAGVVFQQKYVVQLMYEQERGKLTGKEESEEYEEISSSYSNKLNYSHLTLTLGCRW